MATAQHHDRIIPHMGSLGKEQNAKFEVQFLLSAYCFHTIAKSKIFKLNPVSQGLSVFRNSSSNVYNHERSEL